MYWRKYSTKEINNIIFNAINKNINYREQTILGLPASYLDPITFNNDTSFLKDRAFLTSLITNANHIGCHTLECSEPSFIGTQEIEKDLIRICSEEILSGKKGLQDGYISSGGTEANIQAMWIYRNYFLKEFNAKMDEISVLFTEDTHYSIPKGVNILNLHSLIVKVNNENRSVKLNLLQKEISSAQKNGTKYFIVILNMGTTMFGSIDDIDGIINILDKQKVQYKLHVDGAFGGFIYPFTKPGNKYSFKNPNITSFTIDAHKMLQAPYGTGIFLIRKGYMKYVLTEEAKYIKGKDYTICGSRSGANAIAAWIIIHMYGSRGWKEKMNHINKRTDKFCEKLNKLNISYYRNPYINIIALRSDDIPTEIALKFHLVPDSYNESPKWWKIVVMDHVKERGLNKLILDIREYRTRKSMDI
ncbi:MAG: pyridoxal-dependent decarboxylase [Flavobacteriales bacterium]|jgi:glutamate/tyrosine decarboxylase-like PLP-dependent enzyme|nr:pyridoxal-dependent decarboxylase [Flavobacteriales bacterium]